MDQNEEETKFSPLDYVKIGMIGGVVAFSTYHLAKLGVDYVREGVRILKEKKDQK